MSQIAGQREGHIKWMQRLLDKDTSLWTGDAEVAARITQRLGWLDAHSFVLANLGRVRRFVDDAIEDGFDHVVLLGMGGSSLAAEVFAKSFRRVAGHPALTVLDSTAPDAVGHVVAEIGGHNPLFIVASKSGGTAETMALYRYFRHWCGVHRKGRRGDRFVAITDAGSTLQDLAREHGFRDLFINPEDIGGRYSALSYFGLVPAALLGIDIQRLLSPVAEVFKAGSTDAVFAVTLGSFLGEHARNGRNKLTLMIAPRISSLGTWIEQLVAESTGKDGVGIVPVNEEPLQPPTHYGKDRVFACVEFDGDENASLSESATALARAGHPVYRWHLSDLYEIGAEFSRWQIATAIACAVLNVNPFDEPDVNATKERTRKLLYGSPVPKTGFPAAKAGARLSAFLKSASQDSGGYLAILAYLPAGTAVCSALQAFRQSIMLTTKAATCVGFGPRYLHSTGQLHKGGNGQGSFIVLTADTERDLPIPGNGFGFQRFIDAQAMGDITELAARKRRVLHINLGPVATAEQAIDALTSKLNG